MTTEDNLENLDDDGTDGGRKMGKQKTAESSDTEDSIEDRSMPNFRKVNTVPKALHKSSE